MKRALALHRQQRVKRDQSNGEPTPAKPAVPSAQSLVQHWGGAIPPLLMGAWARGVK